MSHDDVTRAFGGRRIDAPVARGRVTGWLADGESLEHLIDVLLTAPEAVAAGTLPLLVHGDLRPHLPSEERERERDGKRSRVSAGRAKRYVVRSGEGEVARIVKLSEVTSLGNALLGAVGSVARREHHHHQRAEGLALAVAHTRGFLEWRRGLRLVRAAQIQTEMGSEYASLEEHLRGDLERRGDVALDDLGAALAETHAVPFFHADLKGFHAWVEAGAGDAYRLRWLDLARVSFRLTRRKRLINLYQALRFVVPDRAEAQERFVGAYCRTSGWHRAQPASALRAVRRFLAYKLRTHPVIES